MTKLEKLEERLHEIIESVILDHGYVLRTFDTTTVGALDHDSRDCCIKGAVSLVTGCEAWSDEVGYELGISPEDVNAIESGFENDQHVPQFRRGIYQRLYPDLYRLGEELRERYVVKE
jgi:hypothetical protein